MSKKGFTLVELVIVIVIVGILSIIAVPIYRGYVEKAKQTEGRALVGAIRRAETIYYAQHGSYYMVPGTVSYDEILDIDARSNKYYKFFYTVHNNSALLDMWAHTASSDNLYIGLRLRTATGKVEPITYNSKDGTYGS